MMKKDSKIFIAGHKGLVGSALYRELQKNGHTQLLTKTRNELDLRDQRGVDIFFATEKPEFVFLGAAKVGGIHANNMYPAEFIYDNLVVQSNIIQSAYKHGVQKLLFLGSSCIYPKHAPQPMTEDMLLSGALEPSNEWYAIAKIAGLKMCAAYKKQYGSNFISVMPTNLYGPKDNYHKENSHVLPALLRRFHEAKQDGLPQVTIWGTGTVRREFLFVEDMARACIHIMNTYSGDDFVNIGTGEDVSIKELAEIVKNITGYEGELAFDTTRPDGTQRKLLDVSKIRTLGWKHDISLEEGIHLTYQSFLSELKNGTLRN